MVSNVDSHRRHPACALFKKSTKVELNKTSKTLTVVMAEVSQFVRAHAHSTFELSISISSTLTKVQLHGHLSIHSLDFMVNQMQYLLRLRMPPDSLDNK